MKRIQFELITRLQECAEIATYVALYINGYLQAEKPVEDDTQEAYNKTIDVLGILRRMIDRQKAAAGENQKNE